MPLLAAALLVIAAMVWLGVVRLRQASREVRSGFEAAGYRVVRLEHRVFRHGPLFWTTTGPQLVFRAIVTRGGGAQMEVWARWGRRWLPGPDRLEFRWDEND